MGLMIVKGVLSLAIIFGATYIGKRAPSLAGLIGVMPLTGLLVFIWLCVENKAQQKIMLGYSKGALWGILPSLAFFAALFAGIRYGLSPTLAIAVAMAVWIVGAIIHQHCLG